MFADILISGLTQGSIYALLAVGFSLIFGVANILNLAHTAFYMVSAYGIYGCLQQTSLPLSLAMFIAVAASTLLGLFTYQMAIRPIREHQTAVMIVTISLAIVLQEGIHVLFGNEQLSISPLVEGYYEIVGTRVSYQHLITLIAVVVTLFFVWFLLRKTRFGLATRCVAQDSEIANLMGMNVSRIAMGVMGLSAFLAAIAGAVVAPLFVLSPTMWMHPLIMTMAVVVLGGLGSLKGSLIGAFILGLAEAVVVFSLPDGSFLKGAVALSILILMLLIRPEGLFGVAFEEER